MAEILAHATHTNPTRPCIASPCKGARRSQRRLWWLQVERKNDKDAEEPDKLRKVSGHKADGSPAHGTFGDERKLDMLMPDLSIEVAR
jgi:hypothetical protein